MRFSPTPWLVASIAFIVLGISRGLHSSFGVFNVALLDTFGWSRGATAGIFSIVLTVDALLSPVVGHLLDRYGTKKIALAGIAALILGLLLSSRVSELWQLYISFGIILALGFTFTGMVPHIFLVSEWFSSKRASAIGFVLAATLKNPYLAMAALTLAFMGTKSTIAPFWAWSTSVLSGTALSTPAPASASCY